MAIGGDQGGSIRIPCSWCGLVGLKPTWGLVPYTGAVPIEVTLDHLGTITRTVEDCAVFLEAIAGYDNGFDPRQPRDLKVPEYTKCVSNYLSHVCVGPCLFMLKATKELTRVWDFNGSFFKIQTSRSFS